MQRPLLYYLTPCILAAGYCFDIIIVMIVKQVTGKPDRTDLFLYHFIPALFILLVIDYAIKSWTKGNVLYIWIIEAIIIAISVIGFSIH